MMRLRFEIEAALRRHGIHRRGRRVQQARAYYLSRRFQHGAVRATWQTVLWTIDPRLTFWKGY